ncbi:hypothetical protein ACELLULO517_09240 [Acidisoma cellulosilytica]|uniref:Phage tail protein n=1 Tax=Acidisoma cellulosilyticum TaxID=2802395 RepID=A0A963Z207_9PROT|nr:hypothetical protein [Acidisoma cellulosilyticum]MCB8880415.1 hypothetical protein [Acidisoma cellulosilyticum]
MTTTVTLGPYTLDAFEVPTAIRYGGRQRLVVHDLPGGGRVTDVLGGTDSDIAFSGIISGKDADTKAQLLDALRMSGLTVPLFWSEQYFIVILAEVSFDYRKPWWIPYQLRCSVQSNLLYGAAASSLTAAASIAADLASASSFLTTAPAGLTSAQSAISSGQGTALGSSTFGQSVTALTTAQADLAGQITSAGAGLPGFDLSLQSTEPAVSPGSLTTLAANASQLASLTAAQAYLGRGLSTLANIGS